MTTLFTPTVHDAFTANSDVHIITSQGLAYSNDANPALYSANFTGLTLLNYGGIVSTGGDGLKFTTLSTGSIINEASGYISGVNGVDLLSTGVSLTNFGSIEAHSNAGSGVLFNIASSDNNLDNRGSIVGERFGVRDLSSGSGNNIVNRGTIEGKTSGIDLWTLPGVFTDVVNYGTIKGGIDVDIFHLGSLMLSNQGTISGGISLASTSSLDADQIHNAGVINGDVAMGDGNDLFDGIGGAAVSVFGGNGVDHINGSRFGDNLQGDNGDDSLWGEGGSDTLTGGANADNFNFDTALKSAGVDTITDFTHNLDHILLSHSIFTKTNAVGTLAGGQFFVGTRAHDANDHIIYNASNGWLIYDTNGNKAGGATHFATLDAHLTVTAADFLIV